MDLEKFGWNSRLSSLWRDLEIDPFVPGRVIADYGAFYKIGLPREITAESSGKLHYVSAAREMPKVGDWVAVQIIDHEHGVIHEVLPRQNEISRKQPGESIEPQVLATNIDVAFLVQALDHDFNPRRLQRYLFQLQRERIRPVIVLNKADQAVDIEGKVAELQSIDIEIIVTSALERIGMDSIAHSIEPGKTAVFLGSSGVGKSTITNALLGQERQVTHDIRMDDSRGRHTTTHRELFILPNGGLVIDTPGLRELQLWGTEGDLDNTFPDIEALAMKCKFSNCSHTTEPDCAVLQARASGALDSRRLEDYFKLQKELRYLATQVDVVAARERKLSNKKVQKEYNQAVRPKKK
jgi:ribosome biogenesis GTPase / thiamine phosphate phosphatase